MTYLANRVKVSTATTGTGPITIGAADAGYQTPASAGVPNGATVSYAIEDGVAAEIGSGVYSAGTVTRTLIWSSTGSLLNLTGSAKWFLTPLATDIASVDVQPFAANGTWTKPTSVSAGAITRIFAIAGGTGGGSGRRGAAASARSGGSPGGGGGWTERTIPTALLGATEPVIVGAGGIGGAAAASDNGNGSTGSAGGNSSFGVWAMANGGAAAGGGGTSNITAPVGGIGSVLGGQGSNTSITLNISGPPARPLGVAPGGGGAGGSISAADVVLSAGPGSAPGSGLPIATIAGGATGSTTGAGGTGGSPTSGDTAGSGGGGGGAASNTSAAFAGGDGGFPGGGGGGGGASLNGFASGKGGNGGGGFVLVITTG